MSVPMKPSDPAYWMLFDGHTTTPVVRDPSCYICRDPEYAQMGLSLCRVCVWCQTFSGHNGHVPADDTVCTVCEIEDWEYTEAMREIEARPS